MISKRDNQRDKILVWLQMRGERGVLNTELTELCMRFGARIYELRKAGYDIKTVKLDESRYRFVLSDTDVFRGEYAREDSRETPPRQSESVPVAQRAVQERLFA